MNFELSILGCGSAKPSKRHQPSSQILNVRGKFFMIDCGEGTQLQLRRSKINFNKIQAVFISHIHGDHCFGLIGMISTFGLQGRTAPLHVFSPEELEQMLTAQVSLFCPHLSFEVVFHAVDPNVQKVVSHIRRDMIDYLEIPVSQINNIKMGADWTREDGTVVPNSELVTPADQPRSYAYCSDTRYIPTLHERLKNVDLLYHESTYGEDNLNRAETYWHSTARQAALVARDAGAKRLLLGHYSSRYQDENVLLEEARAVFKNTYLTDENDVFDI